MDDFILLSEKELVKKKKIALLFSIITQVSSVSEIDEHLLSTIEVDNDNVDTLQNCFLIDTTNGECFAVIAPHELKNYILDYMMGNYENYTYSFEEIANIFDIDFVEVENYFLHHALLGDEMVVRQSSKIFASGQGFVKFLIYKDATSIDEYIEKYVSYFFSIGKEKDLLLEDYSVIEGFYVIFIG